MIIQDLIGNFHAHITVSVNGNFDIPNGWKKTIILLSKDDRHQTDVMMTRHFRTGTSKIQNVDAIVKELDSVVEILRNSGITVTRVKLEHESLPTLPVNHHSYRECHIKVKKPYGYKFDLTGITQLVPSRNPMEISNTSEVVFLNARFYSGSVAEIENCISEMITTLVHNNQCLEIKEVKIESTIYDSNHELDKWWA